MNLQAVATSQNSPFLPRVLLANATVSGLSGLVMALWASQVNTWLGLGNATALLVTGVLLVIFAAEVAWVATRDQLNAHAVRAIIAIDVAWVVGSALLLASNVAPLTTAGVWVVAIVALGVADFAILQTIGLRRAVNQ